MFVFYSIFDGVCFKCKCTFQSRMFNVVYLHLHYDYEPPCIGIHEVTRKIFADGDFGRVDVLDLSDCQLEDECLIRLVPVFGHVSELYLSDNNFTWYEDI